MDRGIIDALIKDPQASNSNIALSVGASEMTIARRLKALIEERLIKVTVQRDMRQVGFNTLGFADVYVEGMAVQVVGRALATIPEAYSVTYALGHPQIIVMLMARDPGHLLEIVVDSIGKTAGVRQAVASVALSVLNHRAGIASL